MSIIGQYERQMKDGILPIGGIRNFKIDSSVTDWTNWFLTHPTILKDKNVGHLLEVYLQYPTEGIYLR